MLRVNRDNILRFYGLYEAPDTSHGRMARGVDLAVVKADMGNPVLDDELLLLPLLVERLRRRVDVNSAPFGFDIDDLGEVPDIEVQKGFALAVVDVPSGHPVVEKAPLPGIVVLVVDLPGALTSYVDEDVLPYPRYLQACVTLKPLEKSRCPHRDHELPSRLLGRSPERVDAVRVIAPERREDQFPILPQDRDGLPKDCALAQVMPDVFGGDPRTFGDE